MKGLMCTDGSKFSEEAIESGGYLIRGSAPNVTILRVVPDFEKEYREYSEYAEVFKEEIHRLRKLGVPKSVAESLEEGREILGKLGIKTSTKTREGKAAEEILKEAEEGNYNLVVHRANTPVLVVKSK